MYHIYILRGADDRQVERRSSKIGTAPELRARRVEPVGVPEGEVRYRRSGATRDRHVSPRARMEE